MGCLYEFRYVVFCTCSYECCLYTFYRGLLLMGLQVLVPIYNYYHYW